MRKYGILFVVSSPEKLASTEGDVIHETLYNESILVSFRSKGENTELEKTSKRC